MPYKASRSWTQYNGGNHLRICFDVIRCLEPLYNEKLPLIYHFHYPHFVKVMEHIHYEDLV